MELSPIKREMKHHYLRPVWWDRKKTIPVWRLEWSIKDYKHEAWQSIRIFWDELHKVKHLKELHENYTGG